MTGLIRIVNEQESFLRGIQREAKIYTNHEIIAHPKGYFGVQRQINDIVRVGGEIGKEVGCQSNELVRVYSTIKSFFNEKLMGRKRQSIEELLNAQSRNIMLLNSNLRYINEEAREERNNLIEYYEEICDEFRYNIVTVPERQKRLRFKTHEMSATREKLKTMKGYDDMYFQAEKKFRESRRNQAEEEHDYVMRMRDTVKLQQEKGFLDIMEQLLTKSIHLSEVYSRDAEYIERHVERTKNVYIRLIRQQGQFFMLRDGVEKLKEYLVNLQGGVMKGIGEMNSIVNGVDSLNAVYAPNMGSLKLIMDDIRNAENQKAIEMEGMLGNKLVKR